GRGAGRAAGAGRGGAAAPRRATGVGRLASSGLSGWRRRRGLAAPCVALRNTHPGKLARFGYVWCTPLYVTSQGLGPAPNACYVFVSREGVPPVDLEPVGD